MQLTELLLKFSLLVSFRTSKVLFDAAKDSVQSAERLIMANNLSGRI